MAASQNAKTLAYRSISKAAVFLFSYNLSFNPRTMFCVKGKKSFSAIAKKNRTTFGRNFTLRNTRLQAVILQAYHAVITLDPGLYCSKGRLKTPAKVGSFTVSGQRVVNYSIKIVSILRPLDYVFASPTENVKSRLVPTCLDDSFQKRDTLN